MLSLDIARELREAGLRWQPRRGDHFVVADRGMDDEIFVLSDMTIEVHEFPTGPVIGFNGTVEWALDSLDKKDALWLPSEDQLREYLGARFVRLERNGETYEVVAVVDGGEQVCRAGTAADAYGKALLSLLRSLS